MNRFLALAARFGRDERGVFAVLFGLMAIVLIAFGGAVVDYVRLEQTKNQAQVALDAATLALQPDITVAGFNQETIRKKAEDLVRNRIGDASVVMKVAKPEIDTKAGSLTLSGELTIPTYFVNLVGVPTMSAGFRSQAVRGALDMEISVALDITGSMKGQRIADLKASVLELIDSVVADDQSLNYSKMALVPYAQAVNAGVYADALRGPIRGPKGIKTIAWTTGNTKAITAVDRTTSTNNPAIVTANGHGFSNGDWVYIWNVSGMSSINNRIIKVSSVTTNTFQLAGINGRNNGFSGSASVVKCTYDNCALLVTSNLHGYKNNEYVRVTNVGGLTAANDVTFQVSEAQTNTLKLTGALNGAAGAYVANTGDLHCTWQSATEGCTYYYFSTAGGGTNTLAGSTCVTERAINGTNDAPPTTTLVGRNYAGSNNPCIPNAIVPLTDNKTTLRATANALTDGGSTSGSLGTLWSWYMLSPEFGYAWPFDSRPAAYNHENLLKAAIIMTDGEYNTVHCEGVVARNSTSGSGATTDQTNCNAPNGDAYQQARAYCDAMKAKNITVYTVAFYIPANTPARAIMDYCATSPQHAFTADNGAQLRDAFRQIARILSSLRIAQ
ncbi:pilus assembly protein TadG-related protein [Devosia sp. 2618]|uniref:TadE/TadG family type IV pilus assembly protein n=1 Tax=Devosia sp. 2618 TaxID=3156454 RepID=UPI00339A2FF0